MVTKGVSKLTHRVIFNIALSKMDDIYIPNGYSLRTNYIDLTSTSCTVVPGGIGKNHLRHILHDTVFTDI